MKAAKFIFLVLVFLLIIESAFAIHEYGHLKELQKRNIPVEEFSLGIGPRLYQHKTDSSLTVSFRLIPIMAYVKPTPDGQIILKEKTPLWDKIVVSAAGVRNNLLVGLAIVIFLQILGWLKGQLSFKELASAAAVTPFKALLRLFAFIIGCLTLGRVNLAEKFLLSTGGVVPPKPLKSFVCLNLMLGLFNLVPIPPLDGSHMLEAFLAAGGVSISIDNIPTFVMILLFAIFYMIADRQDWRMLAIDQKKPSS
jgi:membrane-associated protease RseP (regulator of RpoE activity)